MLIGPSRELVYLENSSDSDITTNFSSRLTGSHVIMNGKRLRRWLNGFKYLNEGNYS